MKKILLPVLLISSLRLTAQTNYALSFNGTNTYVEVSDNNALDLSANFTLEAWIYPTGAGSDATEGGMIINKENSFEIDRFADGSIQFAMSTSGLGSEWSWTNTGFIILPDLKGNNNGTLNNFALTGSGSNFVTQNSSLTVLPLQWLSFTAQADNKQALLNWSTAQEKNTSQFIIQRSSNGVDWTSIGSVAAAGNSTAVTNYSYTDMHPLTGLNFYRIEEKDIDDRNTYSEIRELKFDILNSVFTILNNPVQDGMLKVYISQPTLLSLYDYKGSLLWQKQSVTGSVSIDLNKYAQSLYILKAGGQAEKILKQ